MRIYSLVHISLIAILLAGMGYCTRDAFEGPDARLLVKPYGAPDSQYASEITVFLTGVKGSKAVVEVNTNYQWYFENTAFHSTPGWCDVSTPSGIFTGFVTDKTITFTDKGNNVHPFYQQFTLVLRNAANPNVSVKINVVRNVMNEEFRVKDHVGYRSIITEYFSQPNVPINVTGIQQALRFELETAKAWTLTIRPTGVNQSEYVGDWLNASLLAPATSALRVGTTPTIAFSTEVTGTDLVIELVVEDNISNRYARTAEIELTAYSDGGIALNTIIISIKQGTADCYFYPKEGGLPLMNNELHFAALNSTPTINDQFSKTITIESNRNWNAALVAPIPDWITFTPVSGSLNPMTGDTFSNFEVKVKPNPSLVERSATIQFTGGYILMGSPVNDLNEEIVVKQAGKVVSLEVFDPQNVKVETNQFNVNFAASAAGSTNQQTIKVVSNHPWIITPGLTNFFVTQTSASHDDKSVTTSISFWPLSENTSVIDPVTETLTITCGTESINVNLVQKPKLPTLDTRNFAGTLAKAQTVTLSGTYPISYVAPSWMSVSLVGRVLTIRPFDNEEKDGAGNDIARSGAIIIVNSTTGEDVGEVVVNQDKRWWIRIVDASGWQTNNGVRYPIPMPSTDNPLVHTAISFTGDQGHNNKVTFVLDGFIGGNVFSVSYVRVRDDALIGGNKRLAFGILAGNPPGEVVVASDPALNATTTHVGTLSVPCSFTLRPNSTRAFTSQTAVWNVTISVPALSDVKVTLYVKQYDQLNPGEGQL